MLSLSKRVEYALMAILHMAGEGSSHWCSSKGIAERYMIPPELMGKVLQSLARAAIVRSSPGAHGGYQLAMPLENINLGMVIEAVEGPIRLTDCQHDPGECDQYCACSIRGPLANVQAQLLSYIHSIPLAQFRANPSMEIPS